MGRRGKTATVIVALLVGLCLVARSRSPTPPGATELGGVRVNAVQRPRTVAAPSAQVVSRSESSAEAANHLLADLLGLSWVSCPQTTVPGRQAGWFNDLPSGTEPDRFYFSTTEASGVHLLRGADREEVVSVIRWSVDPDGVSTCVEEPPVTDSATLVVVDPDGRPMAGVVAMIWDMMTWSADTGADGTVTVDVYNGLEAAVELTSEGRLLDTVWVSGGDLVTVVADREEAQPLDERQVERQRESLQLTGEQLDAIRRLLRSSDLPDPTREFLVLREVDIAMLLDHRSGWFLPDGTPAPPPPLMFR